MSKYPAGQNIVIPDDVPLAEWRNGPLPDARLEAIAIELFARQYPMAEWGSPGFVVERDDARRFAIRLGTEYAKYFAPSASNAADRLTDDFLTLLWGERRIGSTLRSAVYAFAECTVSDLWIAFGSALSYPRDIEANQKEVEQEQQS